MSGTTSGKLRIRTVAQRMARGESGVTLVEMMVSLFIFAIVSTMFTTAIVQYLHSTSADAIRSRSSTEIATSVQSLDRYVRYAEGVEYDATNHTITMVTPGDSGAKQCVVITYQDATWKNGTVSDYGSVKVKTKPYDASVTSWSTRAVLGSVMNNESGGTSDDSLFASQLFTVDGTNRVVRYSPVTGSYVSGKPVTSNTSTSFTARNVKSGGTAIDFTPCG
ncbi:PulJ/GspJ family protein [Bifidobacterium pseudocatenulatum]|uniref:PulJ/GspJ family protein n=1 Tax=Bifidobacterium pseudocatenulatum TaxID=28026 RepID=UPI0031E594D0